MAKKKGSSKYNVAGRSVGLWMVVTAGTTYLVDLSNGTLTRYPRTGRQPIESPRRPGDGEQLPLVAVRAGREVPMVLSVERDGSVVERTTSPVWDIFDLTWFCTT